MLGGWNESQDISSGLFTTDFFVDFSLFHSSEESSGGWEDWDKTINWGEWESDLELFDFGSFVSLGIKSDISRVDIATDDLFIFSIIKDNFTWFEQDTGFDGDFVIGGEEGFEVGFIDGELVFGAVFKDKGVGGCNVEEDGGFLGYGSAVGFVFDDEIDDSGYAGGHDSYQI